MINASSKPGVVFSHEALEKHLPDYKKTPASSMETRVLTLGDRGDHTLFSFKNVHACFTSVKDLRADLTRDAVVVVDFHDIDQSTRALRALRGIPEHALLPLMLAKSANAEESPAADICDDIVDSPEVARERGGEIWRALHGLKGEIGAHNADMLLLRYLHTRPDRQLTPRRSWNHPLGYHYPLLDALRQDAFASGSWLENLFRQKLIEPTALLARTRHCPSCDYAHLNYVDVCVNCADADIENIPFLHCFACGNIAPDAEFARLGHLACSKCAARLRHIGADYDRALASFRCKPCGARFQDPRILAECLRCGKRTQPNELSRRDVRSWRASEAGHAAARSGEMTTFSPLDAHGFTASWHFTHTLEWMLRLRERHGETCSFGVILVRVLNSEDLRTHKGRSGASLLLEDFALRVRQAVRSTDLAARSNENAVHILLPYADRSACERVRSKIENAVDDFRAPDHGCIPEITLFHSKELAHGNLAESVIIGRDGA